MALNIKNAEVERLATEVAHLARETKTEAIRRALEERKARLKVGPSREEKYRRTMEYLQREVWPNIPPEDRGKVMTKQEEEEILGIGPNGYPE
ncbi:MAG: type II toxin-antitoxin system VapB family antitoxin [Acidobacteriia bacterium]|nr:type II toxin-antitoxin system VapB family antitoxin [Terriglobia bacterium]